MVDTTVLLRFLLEHGWDYTKLPPELVTVPHCKLRRVWHKCALPSVALTTDDVVRALLEVDPPRMHIRGARIRHS